MISCADAHTCRACQPNSTSPILGEVGEEGSFEPEYFETAIKQAVHVMRISILSTMSVSVPSLSFPVALSVLVVFVVIGLSVPVALIVLSVLNAVIHSGGVRRLEYATGQLH